LGLSYIGFSGRFQSFGPLSVNNVRKNFMTKRECTITENQIENELENNPKPHWIAVIIIGMISIGYQAVRQYASNPSSNNHNPQVIKKATNISFSIRQLWFQRY
jgi:hypothetical protein